MKLTVIEDSRGVFVRDLDAGENVAMMCGHDANPATERELGAVFAAAPDLVEALRDARQALLDAGVYGGALEAADAALEKAGVTV